MLACFIMAENFYLLNLHHIEKDCNTLIEQSHFKILVEQLVTSLN